MNLHHLMVLVMMQVQPSPRRYALSCLFWQNLHLLEEINSRFALSASAKPNLFDFLYKPVIMNSSL